MHCTWLAYLLGREEKPEPPTLPPERAASASSGVAANKRAAPKRTAAGRPTFWMMPWSELSSLEQRTADVSLRDWRGRKPLAREKQVARAASWGRSEFMVHKAIMIYSLLAVQINPRSQLALQNMLQSNIKICELGVTRSCAKNRGQIFRVAKNQKKISSFSTWISPIFGCRLQRYLKISTIIRNRFQSN